MQELLAAMQLEGPAPGSGNAADHVQDMRFTFHLTVSTRNLGQLCGLLSWFKWQILPQVACHHWQHRLNTLTCDNSHLCDAMNRCIQPRCC